MKKIRCPLQQQSARHPKAIAFISAEGNLTFGELEQKVQAAQNFLAASGIARGTHVGIVSPNSPDYVILLLALWRVGAVACLLSTRSPHLEIKKQVKQLKCKVIFGPRFSLSFRRKPESIFSKVNGSRVKPGMTLNAPATIMLTSGSSGEPKAVVHTIGNHYFNALGSNENIPVKPIDRWLLSLPLYHVSGLSIIWRCLLGGGAIVFDTEKNNLSPTHVSLVTTQLQRGLENAKTLKFLKSLKAILLGGGPISEDLIQKAKKYRLPIYMTYGLTEMGSQVATTKKSQIKPQILKYRELKISNAGEILVRGDTLFKGYFKQGQIIRATDKQGWFHTGDLGNYNKRDGLKVLGRKDNMFISGGENIYPEEIERALLNTGLVKQAVVVPVKDAEFGFRPVAFILYSSHCEEGAKRLTRQSQLQKELAKTLPSFKIPDTFYKLRLQKGFKVNRILLRESLADFGR